MPPSLLYINSFICEKVIAEQDQVLTAIRLVEIFRVQILPDVPVDRQGTMMTLVVSGRVQIGDEVEHTIDFSLIRPNGDSKPIGDLVKAKIPSAVPGFPGGFNIVVPIVVSPIQIGLHHFCVRFDGEEVRRTPFMLLERKLDTLAQ